MASFGQPNQSKVQQHWTRIMHIYVQQRYTDDQIRWCREGTESCTNAARAIISPKGRRAASMLPEGTNSSGVFTLPVRGNDDVVGFGKARPGTASTSPVGTCGGCRARRNRHQRRALEMRVGTRESHCQILHSPLLEPAGPPGWGWRSREPAMRNPA